jgi:hypothetical protein
VTSYELQVGFGVNINFLRFAANIRLTVNFLYISLSTLNFQLSTVDKTYFVNPQITAFFAAFGQFGVKKPGFLMAKFVILIVLSFCYLSQIANPSLRVPISQGVNKRAA